MTPNALRRILLGVTSVAVVSAVAGVLGPGRPFAVLAFFLAVPGLAMVLRLGLDLTAASVSLGVAVSVAVSTLVAQLATVIGWWHPTAVLVGLAGLSCWLLLWPTRSAART